MTQFETPLERVERAAKRACLIAHGYTFAVWETDDPEYPVAVGYKEATETGEFDQDSSWIDSDGCQDADEAIETIKSYAGAVLGEFLTGETELVEHVLTLKPVPSSLLEVARQLEQWLGHFRDKGEQLGNLDMTLVDRLRQAIASAGELFPTAAANKQWAWGRVSPGGESRFEIRTEIDLGTGLTHPVADAVSEEHARRIVACANACADISTEDLEKHRLIPVSLIKGKWSNAGKDEVYRLYVGQKFIDTIMYIEPYLDEENQPAGDCWIGYDNPLADSGETPEEAALNVLRWDGYR